MTEGDTMRETALLLGLVAAAALVVVGVAMWSTPCAWIVAGALLAGLVVLAFAEVDE